MELNRDYDKFFNKRFEKAFKNECFFRALGPVIMFGQLFTLMPITNPLHIDFNQIKFKLISLQTLKSIIGFCCCVFEFYLAFRIIIHVRPLSWTIIGIIIYYSTCLFCQILLFRLSINWHKMIQACSNHEIVFLRAPYSPPRMRLRTKVFLICFTMLLFALVEHILYLASTFYVNLKKKELCGIELPLWIILYRNVKYHYYKYFGDHLIILLLSEMSNLINTVSWSYIDIMIVAVSIGLNTRVQQLNARIKTSKGNNVTEKFWVDVRSNYNKLTDLVKCIDEQFGLIVILSCSNNLYFVCQQLYNILDDHQFLINKIYLWFSLLYLMGRMAAVLFFAAAINLTSRQSIPVLRIIPTRSWSIEVQRFNEQLLNTSIALTGNQYFFITRTFIFGLAGTIVTYEIVLREQVENGNGEFSLCFMLS